MSQVINSNYFTKVKKTIKEYLMTLFKYYILNPQKTKVHIPFKKLNIEWQGVKVDHVDNPKYT